MSANPDEQHQRQIQARIEACQSELGNLEAEQQRLADRYATLKTRIDALREELRPSYCQAEQFDQWSADEALAVKTSPRFPAQLITMQRDPHLPPPAVVDWLLEQDWSDVCPEMFITYPKDNPIGVSRSKLFEFSVAYAAIGADETCRLFLPIEALEVLRADQAERARIEAEQASTEADEERRKAERDLNRPCELGLLPMITSETGADDEPEIERIICSAISGGADYLNDMPRELSLERITTEGTFRARYLQGPLEVAPPSSDSCLTSEQQLVVDINEVCKLAEMEGVSAIACIGALTACAIAITSQVYNLKMQPDDTNA